MYSPSAAKHLSQIFSLRKHFQVLTERKGQLTKMCLLWLDFQEIFNRTSPHVAWDSQLDFNFHNSQFYFCSSDIRPNSPSTNNNDPCFGTLLNLPISVWNSAGPTSMFWHVHAPFILFKCRFLLKCKCFNQTRGHSKDDLIHVHFCFMWLVSFLLPVQDGVGQHWGNTGHVLWDRHHFPVPPYGHGGRVGVLQLPQLQWDRGWEEHVLWWSDASVPQTRWGHDCVFVAIHVSVIQCSGDVKQLECLYVQFWEVYCIIFASNTGKLMS